MIGTKLEKPITDIEAYGKISTWCNETQKGYIEDKGDYYEVVTIPSPTAEEIAAQELEHAKTERAEAVSKIVVEVDGMKIDGDESSKNVSFHRCA